MKRALPLICLVFAAGCHGTPDPPESDNPPILVIGAGMAGLSAARALHDAGRDVVVFEARDRIGGRIHTRDVGGVPIDTGAMYIHGVIDNPLAKLCDALEIEYLPDAFGLDPIFDAKTGATVEGGFMQIVLPTRGFENQVEAIAASLPTDASMRDGIQAYLKEAGYAEEKHRYASFALTQLLIELYESGPPDLMSLNAYINSPYEEFGGGNHVIPGGYVQVIDALAEGLDIRLGQPVSRIEHDAQGVVISTASGTHRGSHAIVTVPVSILQGDRIEFEPALPAEKRAAIERLDLGNFEKVTLRFEEAFWLDRGASTTFLYIAENPGEFPGFTDWTAAAGGAPTLICMYGGRSARNMLDKWTNEEIGARAFDVLREIFGDDIPKPIDTHVTRWRDDTWTQGSYSYLPVGATGADMQTLGEPVGERLLFAGEATTKLYYATVHGALISGLREAQRIAGDAAGLPGLR